MSEIERAVEAIRKRKPRRVVAFTGAGVSADSGIPTFRGADGLVAQFPRGGSRHSGSVRARSAAGVGVVSVAARAHRARTTERGARRDRPAAADHGRHAERRQPAHAIGRAGRHRAARQHLSRALRPRRNDDVPRAPVRRSSSAMRMRRAPAAGRRLVRRDAAGSCSHRTRVGARSSARICCSSSGRPASSIPPPDSYR